MLVNDKEIGFNDIAIIRGEVIVSPNLISSTADSVIFVDNGNGAPFRQCRKGVADIKYRWRQ